MAFEARGGSTSDPAQLGTLQRSAEPYATYRLQLQPGFGFDEAADIVDYLAELGISHAYLSPVLQAVRGSSHGYDVVDHGRIRDELGGAEAHQRLCMRLLQAGMEQLLDIVPNHMAISADNPFWWDVLENGPSGFFGSFFDVEWSSLEGQRDRILLPLLGDHSGRVIDAFEIKLVRHGGRFSFHYHEHVVPVAPGSLFELLERAASRASSAELGFIADALARLSLPPSPYEDVQKRHRDQRVIAKMLERLARENEHIARAIEQEVELVNRDPDGLDVLLSRQNYRLAYWRRAAHDLSYRRFFDVNSLVALRAEDPAVFEATHGLLRSLVERGFITGLRVDHIDGLRDPNAYLTRLRALLPDGWIVVEKILGPDEALPAWPVDGTTGYDFLNEVTGLLIRPEAQTKLYAFYEAFCCEPTDYRELLREKKRLVVAQLFGSDLNRLTAHLMEVCERNRRFRDYSRPDLEQVLGEVLACFPVYRSYVEPERERFTRADEEVVDQAITDAKVNRPNLDPGLFDFVKDVLTLRVRGDAEREFVARFQQTTGPVMAKGAEDTACYCFLPFVALNEVGGAPDRFGLDSEAFHRACSRRLERHPRALLGTTTHDTKRSEDVRARLVVLSELPDAWIDAVKRWSSHNERFRHDGKPDRNTEYLFYQTLVGAWPLEPERARAYMLKAVREAKRETSWTRPDEHYEAAVLSFVERALVDHEFMSDVEHFVGPVIAAGRINSLSQTLLKLTVPGVPDIYQGAELWDTSLVDPDNRRLVDYTKRRELLHSLAGASVARVLERMAEGLPKLLVVQRALALRRRRPEQFGSSAQYQPLFAAGSRAEHVVSFLRGDAIAVVVPRWSALLRGDWRDTELELPAHGYRNVLTGEHQLGGKQRLARLLSAFPVCLLERE